MKILENIWRVCSCRRENSVTIIDIHFTNITSTVSNGDELCFFEVISAEITNAIIGQVRIQIVTLQVNEISYCKIIKIKHNHMAYYMKKYKKKRISRKSILLGRNKYETRFVKKFKKKTTKTMNSIINIEHKN